MSNVRKGVHTELMKLLEDPNLEQQDWRDLMTIDRVRQPRNPPHVPNRTPPRETHAINCCSLSQAERIQERKLFTTEAHVHVLANIYDTDILVFMARPPWIEATLYRRGYNAQKLVPRHHVKALLQVEPAPVCLALNNPPTHFTAVKKAGQPTRTAESKQEAIQLDSDSD